MDGPTLSVIVPTYNRASLLRGALESLRRQSLPAGAYEVIVCDDGSTDGTAEMVARVEQEDDRIRLVRSARNRGRSAARNEGIRASRGDVVVFVDSDVVVRDDFLAQHLAAHRRAGTPVLCRGPVVSVPDRTLPERLPLTRMSPAYLDTANASVPRGELVAAGMFDEGFQAYGWEDFDLGFRLQARGLPRVFLPAAVAYHIQPPPTSDAFKEYLRKEEERARTAIYFHAKHPGWRTRLLIQATPIHRAFHFLLTGAGLLNRRNVPAIARGLRRVGLSTLEYLVVRIVLNRHYVEALHREWGKAQTGAAPGS